MLARTARFDQTVTAGHTIAVQAEILYGGVVVATAVPLSSGSVVADRAQFARRTCTVTVAGNTNGVTWIPKTASDPLTPYGHEIRLWRGVTYPDGGKELMPLGVFGIRTVEVDDPAAGIRITGTDRCLAVSEARFLAPFTILAGASAINTLVTLLTGAVSYAPVIVDPRVVDIPMQQVTYDTARDQAVTDIATALGAEVFCDPYGTFLIQPVPDPNGPSVYTVSAGAGGVLVTSKRTLTRDGGYNAVVATGATTTGTAPAATALDTDPTSPTYFYGAYGQVPVFYSSSLLVSTSQCVIAANGILRNFVGVAKSVDLTAVPNPALVSGDVITVVFSDGTREQHIIESLTVDLAATGALQASTRSTTLGTGLS